MKFLIVDDHPLILNALSTELGATNQCLLATSLRECLALIENNPDIDLVVYDLNLPDSHGVQGFMRLRAAAPTMPVLVLSGSVEREEIRQVLDLGAAGFVPKTTANTVLRQAIQLVLEGGLYLPAELVGLRNNENERSLKSDADLTPRENEILPLLALGLPNKKIAVQLGLAENTVRVHVTHILKKMKVSSRAQIASKLLFSAK